MRIHLKLFAILREQAGFSELRLEVPPATSIADLRELLGREYPGLRELLRRSAVAVNRVYATSDATLSEADEVALIPPVSGG